ncbi:MAG: hypothetical protein IJX12_07960 [Lachnospiraceae bacterium]|nr:hypothetical protein [Lachnospiraceae bacterium]
MIITSSAVGMSANSTKKVTYQQKKQTLMSNPVTGEKRYSENEFITTYEQNISGNSLGEGNMISNSPKGIAPSVSLREKDSVQDLLRQIREFMTEFRNRLYLMLGRRDNSERQSIFGGSGLVDISSGLDATNLWNVVNYESYTYKEEENMTFETEGEVITKDGRSLKFNLQVEMTRKFQETTECLTKETGVILTDPLVINLNSNPVGVSDQKWQFDIDGDGKNDSISLLSKGCGFLAFDKNEDGVINDGLELFGAKTGNGFAELLEYDKDGNGWIDEQDDIYNKLNVWIKDDSGEDKLISLKKANVGAIYLGNQRTEFSLMSDDGRKQNAQVRRSGVYLSEDGMARSIQQLDMVTALCS